MQIETMQFLVTAEQVVEARRRLAEADFPMPDDTGEVSQNGVCIRYGLHPAEGGMSMLRLELLDKPWYVKTDWLKKKVRALVAEHGVAEIVS